MSSRRAACLVAILLALPFIAGAQVESDELVALDAWAFSGLDQGEPGLPDGVWPASAAADLLPLMEAVQTSGLTPAETGLLRRAILSPARAPAGDTDGTLLAERARLMFETGETEAAVLFLPQVPALPDGRDPAELAADLQLALGQTAEACAAFSDGTGEASLTAPFWTKLRAVCFALDDNAPAAELAVELAVSQGIDDTWFFNAIFAASGDTSLEPDARFDTGLALALSDKAGLKPSTDTITASRADLAAALAQRDSFPPDLRVQAAGIAAESGLLTADQHREAYRALLALEDFTPRTPIEIALAAAWSETETDATRARALAEVLNAATGNLTRFAAVSRLLAPDLAALTPSDDTARAALTFARAGLAAGDPELAATWRANAGLADPAAGAFDLAWTEGLLVLAGREAGDIEGLTNRLIAAADGRASREALRRLFVLWNGVGIPLAPAARATLEDPPGPMPQGASPMQLRAALAAAEAGANGETILRTLALTRGDPYALPAPDLALLLEALAEAGAGDLARTLALEATGYWKEAL